MLRFVSSRHLEGLLDGCGEAALCIASRWQPAAPQICSPARILVFRNNDLGDVLVVTPLLQALRELFPVAELVVAVGHWAVPCLANNPYISEVVVADAPWFNRLDHSRGGAKALLWLLSSREVRQLRARRFDLGIDVLGSTWGAWLLLLAGIQERFGTRGYATGSRGYTRSVVYDPALHVGRAALRFAELLGASKLPESRPQIFLSAGEREAAEALWLQMPGAGQGRRTRVAIGPGTGVAARSWPATSFQALVTHLAADKRLAIAVIGGPEEDERKLVGRVAGGHPTVQPFPGSLSLRETFALVAAADLVVCNSSVLMHVAAAFHRPTVVVLGESFPSVEEHHAQWGYDQGCFSLGREVSRGQPIASPREVAEFVAHLLPQLDRVS